MRGGQRLEELVVVAQQIGLTGEDLDQVAVGAALEPGHDLAPQPHASVVQLVVHRIMRGRESEPRGELVRVAAPTREQRAPEVPAPRGHPRESRRRGAAQHLQQHRLGLVVARVREEDRNGADRGARPFRARRSARVTGAGFEIRTRDDPDGLDPHRRAEPPRRGLHDLDVVRGTGAQAVVDVDRVDLEPARAREREERERVGAAAATDDDARSRHAIVERAVEAHTRAASTRASQSDGSLSSGTVGRFSGASQTASNARRPASL